MKSWPPDAFAALGLALALGLEWLLPLRLLPEVQVFSMLTGAGVAMVIAGFALEVAAARALAAAGTTARAGEAARVLVTGGPFSWSRNPFYLGLLLVLLGVVLAFSLDWGLLTVPLVAVALDRVVIPREEAMLRQRFAAFDDYARRVPRWLGRRA